jgi:hypothetical protein
MCMCASFALCTAYLLRARSTLNALSSCCRRHPRRCRIMDGIEAEAIKQFKNIIATRDKVKTDAKVQEYYAGKSDNYKAFKA